MSASIWHIERSAGMTGKSNKFLREVPISQFKKRSASLLEEVNKTTMPLRITRRGKAIAEVIPACGDL
jgi:prevent-host-death family protein